MVELSRCDFLWHQTLGWKNTWKLLILYKWTWQLPNHDFLWGPESYMSGGIPSRTTKCIKMSKQINLGVFWDKFYQIICSLLTCLISLSRKNFVVAKGAARRFSIGEDQTNNTLHWTVVFFSLIPKGDTIYLTSNFAGRSSYVDFWETRTLLSSGWFFPR